MSAPLWRSRPTAFDMRPADRERRRQVADGIYLSEGYSNAYLIVTREGRIVVNTGMGFEAPLHKEYFDALDGGPVRYIVLTQGHVDHVGGVDLFRAPGTDIIAHANNAAQQAYDARLAPFRARRSAFAFAEAFARMAGTAGKPPPVQSRPMPTVTFDDRFAFTLGGESFEAIGCPGAETEDSLVLWMPERRVCFTGNVFGALFGHFPNLVTIRGDRHRDALRYVEALELLRELEPEVLLVGHFEPVRGRALVRAELDRIKGAVLYVHDAVVAAMNAGGDVWTAMQPDLTSLNPIINGADRRLEKLAKGVSPTNVQAGQVLGYLQGLAVRTIEKRYLTHTPPADFRVNVNPLVSWIWIGGGIAAIGGLVAIWPAPEARRRRVSDVYAARLARELGRA